MPSRVLLEDSDNGNGDKARAHLRALWNAFLVFATLALAASMTLLVYVALQNNKNGRLIADCTTEGGECYDKSQDQTGKVVASINQVTLASNFCALKLGPVLDEADFDRFTECVRNHVEIPE